MVIGVDGVVKAAAVRALTAGEDLVRAVGDDLVGVHVVRRAGAGLKDIDDELVAHLAVDHLLGGPCDRVGELCIELRQTLVGAGRRELDQRGRADELWMRAHAGDGEVFDGALRLRAIVGVGPDADVAQGVLFDAVAHAASVRLAQLKCATPERSILPSYCTRVRTYHSETFEKREAGVNSSDSAYPWTRDVCTYVDCGA